MEYQIVQPPIGTPTFGGTEPNFAYGGQTKSVSSTTNMAGGDTSANGESGWHGEHEVRKNGKVDFCSLGVVLEAELFVLQ